MDSLFSSVDLFSFFTGDPALRFLQGSLLSVAAILLFLLLFTLRDILGRTHSLAYQILCIVIVALLPGIGFLLYLLIRPRMTLWERAIAEDMQEVLASLEELRQGVDHLPARHALEGELVTEEFAIAAISDDEDDEEGETVAIEEEEEDDDKA